MFIKERKITDFLNFLTFLFLMLGNNLFNRKTIAVMLFLQLFLNRKKIINLFKNTVFAWPLLILLSYCGITIFWSNWPLIAAEELFFQFALLVLCLLIATGSDIKKIFDMAALAAMSVVIINFLYIPIEGISSLLNQYTGVYNHKNNLGLVMAISIILLLKPETQPKSKSHIFIILIALFLLIASQSKTSILILTVGILSFLIIKKLNIKRFQKIFISGLALLYMTSTVYMAIHLDNIYLFVYQNFDEHLFTNRGLIWLTMLNHARDQLFYGMGFDSVWGKGDLSEIYFTSLYKENPLWVEKLAASDGGYIDILLSIGIIGFALTIFIIGKTFIAIILSSDKTIMFVLFNLFNFIVIHNVTETTLLLSYNILWFMFILISIIAPMNHSRNSEVNN